MNRLWRGVLMLSLTVGMLSGVGYMAYQAYREASRQKALDEAQQEPTAEPSANRRAASPHPLSRLRPHPWSSPLNNREFDVAIAGASAAFDREDYEEAIALNTSALEMHPSKDLIWLLLTRRGDCYLEQKEPEKALDDYHRAEQLGGLDATTFASRALAFRQLGKRAEAAKDLDEAIKIDPDDPWIYSDRASILADDGKLDQGLSDYDKALELNPKSIRARLGRAEIYVRQNENQKALRETTIAIQTDPISAASYIARARVFGRLGMDSRAVADLDAASMLHTAETASALNAVAWCRATDPHAGLRDGKKAVAEATAACELTKWKHWSFIDTLAAAYAEARQFEPATKYEKQVITMAPSKRIADTANRRLIVYQHRKAYREQH